jgi:hypothetical protein
MGGLKCLSKDAERKADATTAPQHHAHPDGAIANFCLRAVVSHKRFAIIARSETGSSIK